MKIIIEINEDDFGGVKDGDCISFDECDDYYVEVLKTGRWLRHPAYKQKDFREWDVCSVCGVGCCRRRYGKNPDGTEYETIFGYRFCPNCGAAMT